MIELKQTIGFGSYIWIINKHMVSGPWRMGKVVYESDETLV